MLIAIGHDIFIGMGNFHNHHIDYKGVEELYSPRNRLMIYQTPECVSVRRIIRHLGQTRAEKPDLDNYRPYKTNAGWVIAEDGRVEVYLFVGKSNDDKARAVSSVLYINPNTSHFVYNIAGTSESLHAALHVTKSNPNPVERVQALAKVATMLGVPHLDRFAHFTFPALQAFMRKKTTVIEGTTYYGPPTGTTTHVRL